MAAPSNALRVLVDMDEVLADYDGLFLKRFRERYPDVPYVPLEKRHNFYMSDDYRPLEVESPGILKKMKKICDEPGFIKDLPTLPGSVEAVKAMSEMENVEVFICTSPVFAENHRDLTEKACWMVDNFGREWLERLIITKDKTMVYGHILIDDNPAVKGVVAIPAWKHILFSNHHNRHVDLTNSTAQERLANWTDGSWKTMLLRYMNLCQGDC